MNEDDEDEFSLTAKAGLDGLGLPELTKEELGLAIARGVENAMDFWLSQHDVTVPTVMEDEDAIERAMMKYLHDNPPGEGSTHD